MDDERMAHDFRAPRFSRAAWRSRGHETERSPEDAVRPKTKAGGGGPRGGLADGGNARVGLSGPGRSGEEDRLVTKGVQQIVICGESSRESGDIWYKITQEIPGADSGTWGVEKDGDCDVLLHYAPGGPAD